MDGEHRLLVEVGTTRGAEVMADAPDAAGRAGRPRRSGCRRRGGRRAHGPAASTPTDIRDLLARNLENDRWDEVASRCLTCGNCTLVCPTCFCTSVEDVTDLAGETPSGRAIWDSCFSVDYSYIHGGSIRPSGRSRYRQWLTHKFGTWYDQFGSSGCVGCGRCIAWCPVGIDVTEELDRDPCERGSRRWTRLRPSCAMCRSSRASTPAAARADRGLRLERPLRATASCCSATATRPRRSTSLRHGSVALETFVPARGARHDRDARRRRGRRLVVALPPVPLALRRARASLVAGDGLRRRLPARQVRARPAARLRPDVALRAGGDRAPPVDAAPAS